LNTKQQAEIAQLGER